MTDRELLELAAKAIGFDVEHVDDRGVVYRTSDCSAAWWSPFEDYGQALILGIRLHLDIEHGSPLDNDRYVYVSRCGIEMVRDPVGIWEYVEDEKNRAAATCRALVRAAAEIEKLKGA